MADAVRERVRARYADVTTVEQAQRMVGRCICQGTGWFTLDVEIGHPLFGQAIPCICRQNTLAKKRAERLRERSGIPDDRLREWSFASFRPDLSRPLTGQSREDCRAAMAQAVRHCRRYAQELKGWLVLVGGVGSGKTHLAYAIAAAALQRDVGVYAATTPDMLDMLRASYGDDSFDLTFHRLKSVELLVLDDLGTENAKPWAVEKLYQLINHRYTCHLPLVVTSNVPLAEVGRAADSRVLSRLMEGTRARDGWSREVVLPAADFRPKASTKGAR